MAGEKPVDEMVIGPWKQHVIVVLANRDVIKRPSKYIYLYP